MANLAQIVNVLHAPIMTEGGRMWVTPTYHVLRMHAVHINAAAYRTEIESERYLPSGDPAITATATSGGITVTNRHFDEAISVSISMDRGWNHASLLTSAKPSDQNGPGHEEKVILVPATVHQDGRRATIEVPPHSVVTLS